MDEHARVLALCVGKMVRLTQDEIIELRRDTLRIVNWCGPGHYGYKQGQLAVIGGTRIFSKKLD